MAHEYQAFHRLPISINLLRFSCGYTSQKIVGKTTECTIVLMWWRLSPLRQCHPALHRGIGDKHLRTTCGPGPSKPTAFLGLSSPSHEVAMTKLNGRPRVASEEIHELLCL